MSSFLLSTKLKVNFAFFSPWTHVLIHSNAMFSKPKPSVGTVKVLLDLSNYASKADL